MDRIETEKVQRPQAAEGRGEIGRKHDYDTSNVTGRHVSMEWNRGPSQDGCRVTLGLRAFVPSGL